MTNEFAIKVLTELRGYGNKFANIGFDRKEALDLAIKALEQQPCEYEPFTIAEVSPEMRKLMEEWQKPCEDAVSRQAVIDAIDNIDWYHISNKGELVQGANKQTMPLYKAADIFYAIDALPSVTPKFTDEEIQKMQELEQAQLEKAYELGMQTSFEEWLTSFNTESATCCFTAVQELKKKMEGKNEN